MCERCRKLEDHIADLRNKYGRIHLYFQFKKMEEKSEGMAEWVESELGKLENEITELNERFVNLLKTEI